MVAISSESLPIVCAFKKTDCDVLMRNFGYAVKQNHCRTIPEFEKEVNAAINHQFNDHHSCSGKWYKYVEVSKADWIITNKESNNKLQSKLIYELMWREAFAIHELFVTM